MKPVYLLLAALVAVGTPFSVSDLTVMPKEDVDVSVGEGVKIKQCREYIQIEPVAPAKDHTWEPLPPPDNCGFDPWGVPYCCPPGVLNN